MLKNKIISAFLALIMIFALIPIQVFAGSNVDKGGPVRAPSGSKFVDGWAPYGYPGGIRFSVYYILNEAYGKDENGNNKVLKIGDTADVRPEGLYGGISQYSMGDIYNYNSVNGGNTFGFGELKVGGYKSYVLKNGSISQEDINSFELWFKDNYTKPANFDFSSKTCGLPKLVDYSNKPQSSITGEYLRNYFEHPAIINEIAFITKTDDLKKQREEQAKLPYDKRTPVYGDWQVSDWYNGTYTDIYGKKYENGQWKIFLEPLVYACMWGTDTPTVLSARQIILGDRNSNGGSSPLLSFITWSVNTINSMGLYEDEPILKLSKPYKGNSYMQAMDKDLSDIRSVWSGHTSDLRTNLQDDALGGATLGVGVITSPQYIPKEKTKIIKTYVTVDRYELGADGKPHVVFKTAEDSVVSYLPVSENGKASVNTLDSKDNKIYRLNDIIVSDKDIVKKDTGPAPEVTWNGYAPETSQERIELTGKDIASYMFGKVVNSPEAEQKLLSDLNASGYKYDSLLNIPKELWLNLANDGFFIGWGIPALPSVLNPNGVFRIQINPAVLAGPIAETEYSKQSRIPTLISDTSDIDVTSATDNIKTEDKGAVAKEEITVENKKSFVSTNTSEDVVVVTNKKATPETSAPTEKVYHIIYARYLVETHSKQINIVTYKKDGVVTNVEIVPNDLTNDTGITNLKDISKTEQYKEAKVENWYSNTIYETDKDKIPPSDGAFEGTVLTPIPSLPVDENIYVNWVIEEYSPETQFLKVPEWRLSRYWDELNYGTARMFLDVVKSAHCPPATLSTEQYWKYKLINPNGKDTSSENTPENMKYSEWLHTKTLDKKLLSYITLSNASGVASLSGNANAIKDDKSAKNVLASWITTDDLKDYNISSGVLPVGYTDKNEYSKLATLNYNTKNIHTYYNYWNTYGGYDDEDDSHWDNYYSRTLSPNSGWVKNTPYSLPLKIDFDRYIQQNTDAKKLQVKPEVKSENGKTTLKYQVPNKDIKVYPEYGMLFANDNPTDTNHETIKWVVGDQARLINPVVYQTLEHKVYVVPTSTGIGATDSRAITNARKIGEANKQVFYKGSAVTTAFKLQRGENDTNKGILTVKTFALDIDNSTLKSAWGNTGYNSLEQHTLLTNKVANTNVTGTEKLLIDSPLKRVVEYSC